MKTNFVLVDKVEPAPKRPRNKPVAPRRLRLVSNNPAPVEPAKKRGRGRPKGSKNKPRATGA